MEHTLIGLGSGDNILKPSTKQVRLLLLNFRILENYYEKAKKAIKALPYTGEGYNRAVAILKDRFGKDSEIVKAYVKETLDLSYTHHKIQNEFWNFMKS